MGARSGAWAIVCGGLALACGRTEKAAPPSVEAAAGAAGVEPNVSQPNCAVELAGFGSKHCAVYADGSVWCWGTGIEGGADATWADEPRRIDGIADAARVVVGESHGCAITSSGKLSCWGTNDARQLDDSGTLLAYPARVVDFPAPVRAVGVSREQTCVLDILSHIYCRGRGGGVRQLEVVLPFDIPGPGTALFDVAGKAWDLESEAEPRPLPQLGTDNRALTAPGAPSCLVKRSGSTWCTDYLLDDADETFRARIALGESTLQAGSGDLFMCAMTSGGAVWCDGYNQMGQLGRGVTSTFEDGNFVPGLEDARRLSVALRSACALRADGTVWCWGAYRYQEPASMPTQVSGCLNQRTQLGTLELAAPRSTSARVAAAGQARGQALCECAFGAPPADGCTQAEDFPSNADCLDALAPPSEAAACAADQMWREAQCYGASSQCGGGTVPNCYQPVDCPTDPTWSAVTSYCRRRSCSESGEPLDERELCNGSRDCADGSDELNCTPMQTSFDCGGEQRVPISALCDGADDCENQADERNCH